MRLRTGLIAQPTTMQTPLIEVAIAIVRSADGRILMAQRSARQIGAGYWEIPGGKIEPGEAPMRAAARELSEETGVIAESLRPAACYVHAYRQRRVRLHCYHVDRWRGDAHGREGQAIAWVDPAAPTVGPVLPGLIRLMRVLGLPSHCVRHAPDGTRPWADEAGAMAASLSRHGHLGIVRLPPGAPEQRLARATALRHAGARHGAVLALDGSVHDALRTGFEALHSAQSEVLRLETRPAVTLWLASCNTAPALKRAVELGADAVLLGPVHADDVSSSAAALGWAGFKALLQDCAVPAYAFGGLTEKDAPAARAAGAWGVAVDTQHGEDARYKPS
jgi:8-oxo-dGTP diphosphatase